MSSFHGGLDYKALSKAGIDPDKVIDFSVSINPEPLPQSVKKAIKNAPVERYPDSNSDKLKKIISRTYGLDEDELLIVNGTSQAVFLLAGAYLNSEKSYVLAGPTYSEYGDACRLYSPNEIKINSKEEDGFKPPVEKICRTLKEENPALLWLCSPNNPTGNVLTEEKFHLIRKTALETGTLFILDEAYRCFLSEELQYNTIFPGVVNLRSMTKDFSIPGLRLGYVRASRDILATLRPRQPEWSVSSPAQEAGRAAMEDVAYFSRTWNKVIEMTEEFRQGVEDVGYKTYPTGSNFFLVKAPGLAVLKEKLWKELILVRDCASFGLDDMMRLGTRSREDNEKLIALLHKERD